MGSPHSGQFTRRFNSFQSTAWGGSVTPANSARRCSTMARKSSIETSIPRQRSQYRIRWPASAASLKGSRQTGHALADGSPSTRTPSWFGSGNTMFPQ